MLEDNILNDLENINNKKKNYYRKLTMCYNL